MSMTKRDVGNHQSCR